MADVVLPNTIEAGTEMQAAEVQDNFVALRDAINAMDIPAGSVFSQLVPGRVAWGWVNADGTIHSSGSGDWTSSKTATGAYSINFSPIASATWIGVALPISPAVTLASPWVSGSTGAAISFRFRAASGGADTDTQFFFIAIS